MMIINTWCGNSIELVDVYVCQFAVLFNAFLCVLGHVNLSVAPTEIRDSEVFLFSSTRLLFGLHSRQVHPKYT